jgi:DNA polymerase-2
MERFITANINFSGIEKAQRSYLQFAQVKCKSIEKSQANTIPLSMVSLDIECSMDGILYSIGLYTEQVKQVLMIGSSAKVDRNTELTNQADVSTYNTDDKANISADTNTDIIYCDNESALLMALLVWFKQHDPDLIIGWNVINFDFQVLQKRYDYYGIKFSLGRDGKSPHWRKVMGQSSSEQKFIEIAGRVVLDGIDLLKTATYNFPSFSLDYVANALLGIGKKVDDVDNRMQEITDNFLHNKPALAAYNLEDCRLVWLIFEKTQLLEFAMLRAQLTGLAIDRIGGSVAAFTNLYLPKLHRAGYVAPNMGDGLQGLVSPGGYVMDSLPGLYKNVLVLDFKSLYPSIIRSFCIDPMGLIEGLAVSEEHKTAQTIEGFDGAYFSREQHFLPDIITQLWKERDIAKADKNAALSQAIKIIMNSFYGILGSTGCRFFDPRLAGSITKRSHALLKMTKKWIETKGYQVIYGDTDSIFVHIGSDKSAQESNDLGKELARYINETLDKNLKDIFNIDSFLEIEFETHFSQFLMPTIRGQDIGTKKRYAGLVEKLGQQELIFKGLESVRTDWTELAKTFQRTLYLKVFNQQPVEQYIIEMVNKTANGELDHLLFYRKRIRRKLDHYIKNVPPHVKAARLADEINQQASKPLKFQNKGWIEYVNTTAGPQAKGYISAPLDYQLYIDRQLCTVADAILPFIGTSFDEITNSQMNLF